MMTTGRKYAIALTAGLGLIMGILDNTIVNIALIPISKDLKVDLATVQWLVTGYFLSQAAVIPVAGYLGNRFGSRRIFMLCVAFFTLGSLLCGIAQDATLLIIFRVIQGLGAGALFPLGQSLALNPFEPHERARAMSVIVLPVLLGPILGPILGGWLNDTFNWHYLFLINVPIGIITVYLTWRVMPADKPVEAAINKPFDYIGLTLSTLGILSIVYAFTLVNQVDAATKTALNPAGVAYGWSYWLVWTLAGAGVVLIAVFSVYELRLDEPIMDLRLFKDYNFTISSIITCVLSATVFGSLLLLPVFLQQIRLPHMSALDTGLALVPQGVGIMIGASGGGLLFNRIGARILTGGGTLLVIIAFWQFGNLTPVSDGWNMVPWNLLLGIGLGLTFIPSQTLAFLTLTGPALAKASSLFNVTRQIASTIATAVIVTLLVQQTTSHATQLQVSLPPGTTPPNPSDPQFVKAMEQLASQAGTQGSNDVFIYLAIGTILVFLLSFLLPSRKTIADQEAAHRAIGEEAGPIPVHVG